MKAQIKMTSLIFDKQARQLAMGQVPFKAVKLHKASTKEKMVIGPHTGRLYGKGKGTGFKRLHRASARGQRPAPDTTTLLNAVADRRTGPYKCEVYIKPAGYAKGGPSAEVVAEMLQGYHDRPIQNEADAAESQVKMNELGQQAIQRLL